MYRIIIFVCLLLLCSPALARGGRGYSYSARPAIPAGCSNATAQGVAEIMARTNSVGHWGGNPGYEGCGCGPTQAKAYEICCFAGDSSLVTVDVGYAQSVGGTWFCCRRYVRK